jgi:hypothetical protein
MTHWEIKGREFVHCNCAYGCPCQFNALPTQGNCSAVLAVAIDQGHHGPTTLDGLNTAAIAAWPGAIHEGRGQILPIVDEQATQEQRTALLRIMSGEDTDPGATFFQVFATTFETVHEPVFARIKLEVEVASRIARLVVPSLIEARGESILNPVTGAPHQAQIRLPEGFEYTVAEAGRGWAKTMGPIPLALSDSHAHFAELHMTQSGVVR